MFVSLNFVNVKIFKLIVLKSFRPNGRVNIYVTTDNTQADTAMVVVVVVVVVVTPFSTDVDYRDCELNSMSSAGNLLGLVQR